MKVLLCFHSIVTLSNHRLAEELSKLPDIELHVFSPDWWPEEARNVRLEKEYDPHYSIRKAPIIYFREPKPNLFAYRSKLAKAIRQIKPDIIDFYEEPCSLAMGQVLLLRQLFAPQARLLFYSAQNIYKKYPPPFNLFEKWTFRTASAGYICNNDAGLVLRKKGYKGKLQYIPLGVDNNIFRPLSEQQKHEKLTSSGIPAGKPVVGFLGRLHREKGINPLLEAIARLPEVQLMLVGDGPHRDEFVQKAKDLGIQDRVHFVGVVNRLEAPEYLNCMDVFALPSLTMSNVREQFGRVIIEAQLCNVPVVGTTCGFIPTLVGENGLIVPENDPVALKDAISDLLSNEEKRLKMAEAARKHALENYTWEKVANQRYQLYKTVLYF